MAKELKNEIKYGFTLNEEQKIAKGGVFTKDVSIFLGSYGSGKTAAACQAALDLLFKKHVSKIYLTRPIDFNATGYLSGSLSEKMYFHTFPLKQNLYACYNKEKIDKLFTEGLIEIVPIDYLKGYTIADAVMVIDEFEDISYRDFLLILSRLGKDSKMIFTGSEEQIDIKDSCIPKVKLLQDCEHVNYHTFKSYHRNGIVPEIIKWIEDKEKQPHGDIYK